jgi:hypothetical protein
MRGETLGGIGHLKGSSAMEKKTGKEEEGEEWATIASLLPSASLYFRVS